MKRPSGKSRPQPRPAPTPGQGATRRSAGLQDRLRNYLRGHAQVALGSLGRLYRTPFSTLLTTTVIAIALALPSGLLALLDNLQRVSAAWEGSSSISLFLKPAIGDARAQTLARELEEWPGVGRVRSISREQALAEFREFSGFGEALDSLDENPLPNVLEIRPKADHVSDQDIEDLLDELGRLPEVEAAQLDLQWVRRFNVLMDIGRRGVWVVGSLLGLAVLLIVGNTIRLEIQNRRDEIEVSKLIGGTDAFIRRPFLYTGLWYGLFGAVLAWIVVSLSFWLIDAPARRLAGLYDSGFLLAGLSWSGTGLLLLLGLALGLAGSWLAVGRHLGAIEPS